MDSVDSASVPPSQPEESAADRPEGPVPEINERMTSVPSAPNSRPRLIEVSTDQTGGAPEALEMHHSAVLEAATFASNVDHEALLFVDFTSLEQNVFLFYCYL